MTPRKLGEKEKYFRIARTLLDAKFIKRNIGREGSVSPSFRIAAYAVLARYTNNDTQQCFCSISTIARMMGVSFNTAKNAIYDLEFLGAIHVQRRQTKTGRHLSHLYTLLKIEDE